jgi:hypothetical protein
MSRAAGGIGSWRTTRLGGTALETVVAELDAPEEERLRALERLVRAWLRLRGGKGPTPGGGARTDASGTSAASDGRRP